MTSDFNDFNRCLKVPMLPAEVFVKTIRHIFVLIIPEIWSFSQLFVSLQRQINMNDV